MVFRISQKVTTKTMCPTDNCCYTSCGVSCRIFLQIMHNIDFIISNCIRNSNSNWKIKNFNAFCQNILIQIVMKNKYTVAQKSYNSYIISYFTFLLQCINFWQFDWCIHISASKEGIMGVLRVPDYVNLEVKKILINKGKRKKNYK